MQNPLRDRLLTHREVAWGTWVSSSSLTVVDALRSLDLSWVMIDTEHAPVNPETLAAAIALLAAGGPTPLVRVGTVDPYPIKQALDAGARGVLAPLVASADEARRCVSFAKYPPVGVRGAAAAAASRYGLELSAYLREANDRTIVGVQIETREALDHVEEIASVPGVDLLFVGPQDLTLHLGLGDQRTHPRVREAMAQVVRACEAHGKVPGTLVVSREEKRAATDLGFRFISLASDLRFLLEGGRTFLAW